MPDRQPQAWETNASLPFLTLPRDHGVVEVWAHGFDRFTVKSPDGEQVVAGFDPARQTAHELARELE
jgi:hypothetical protein